jgi:hypothetical protein
MFEDLIERVKSVFTKPAPVEFAPPLSREKESAMIKVFDARSALLHDLTIDNYCDAKKAEWDMWLSEMDAQAEVVNAHLASKEAK